MPYYQEYFENAVRPFGYSVDVETPTSVSLVNSFRSRPHLQAKKSVEVPDYIADPYASFLATISARNYRARLAERGMSATGTPDRGHSFDLRRFSYGMTSYRGSSNSTRRNVWLGPINAYPTSIGVHNGSDVSPSTVPADLQSFAQQAYSRVAPSAVVFDAAQFLGELREGLPSLFLSTLRSGTKKFQAAGSDYLNVEFGWKPFISDLQNALKVLTSTTETFSVKSGERVHKQYSVPPVQNSSSRVGVAGISTQLPRKLSADFRAYDSNVTESAGFSARYDGQKTRTVNRWFEGEFTSFLELGFDPSDYLSRASQMMNLKITPRVLWELSPWSWLTDWYLRLGDSIAANELAANDKLILHYGYAMEKVVDTTMISWQFEAVTNQTSFGRLVPVPPLRGVNWSRFESKRRIRANPYGFQASSPDQLSANQLAILGALGLSQGLK